MAAKNSHAIIVTEGYSKHQVGASIGLWSPASQ